ncbi:prolipoprotein diacylglyceryl transferase [Mycobacterium sp. 852002-10029_SCH5224772]|uniref:prolipoprotein diacylglyceryl transferase n=1 Tax=Mycobacterium sp. 852002-10029_SCH5224772 TaxID=1834083 RepID=UPI0008010033|nr:prolipoprotein diacylglyceryl transferase [Mycobacterium sp. 852002-10029_SCH5224772]OBE92409.1 prolipoprotein diacylglyceryl transferase [Mycobacterium sp. 852002-10029_SCH5224772]
MTKLLAYFPSPSQGVWHLGPLPIRAYALFIIAGIVAALLIGDRRWEARGGERGVIYDIALWTVPFGLIGGRLYHLATDWRTYWGPGGAGLGAAVRIWDGGLGIWGAVALGAVGAWIGCRRHGIPLPAFADAIAPGIILAQAIGRLGNYFNQELYGRETTLPWGLEIFYRRDPSGYIDPHSLDGISTGQIALVVQPTFLYELIWNVLIFVALIYADRRFTLGHGRLFALYVAGYCVGRFCVELLRDDTATLIAGIRINSFTSTFVFIGAVVYLMAAPRGREDPESLRGNQYVDEESAELEPATVAAATAAADSAGAVGAADDDGPAESAVGTAEVPEEPEAVRRETEEPDAEESEAEEVELGEPEAEAEVEEPQADEREAEAESDEPEAEAVADVAEAEESEAEEVELGEPEAEAEVEEPQADEREAEAESDEPEAEAVADVAEAEESETEEVELGEPEAEAEVEEPQAEPDEATDEEPESAGSATEPRIDEKIPDQPETRRRWGSRLRNRLSGR